MVESEQVCVTVSFLNDVFGFRWKKSWLLTFKFYRRSVIVFESRHGSSRPSTCSRNATGWEMTFCLMLAFDWKTKKVWVEAHAHLLAQWKYILSTSKVTSPEWMSISKFRSWFTVAFLSRPTKLCLNSVVENYVLNQGNWWRNDLKIHGFFVRL